MAHSLSAKKRVRQNAKRRVLNRQRTSATKTQIKKFLSTAKEGKDLNQIDQELREAQRKIQRLVVKGVIHRNTAGRKISQLSRHYNTVKAKIG